MRPNVPVTCYARSYAITYHQLIPKETRLQWAFSKDSPEELVQHNWGTRVYPGGRLHRFIYFFDAHIDFHFPIAIFGPETR